jgi:hypothetical protein
MMHVLVQWLHDHGWLLAAASALALLVGAAAGVFAAVRMPADYLIRDRRGSGKPPRRHPVLRYSLVVASNVGGWLLILTGLVLSLPLVPGPGLLLILIGLSLVDLPGKHKLEQRLLRTRVALGTINRLRRIAGKPPVVTEPRTLAQH